MSTRRAGRRPAASAWSPCTPRMSGWPGTPRIGPRSSKAIKGLGVLDGYGGHLHDAGRGHRIPAGVVAHPVPQRVVPSVQAAIGPPLPEVREHRLPRGTPWAAAARRNRCARGEDRVDDVAAGCLSRRPQPVAATAAPSAAIVGPSGRSHTGAATRGKTPLQQGRRSATIRLALPPARPLPEERKLATKPQRRDRAA